jgi:S1/P1 Nuclease
MNKPRELEASRRLCRGLAVAWLALWQSAALAWNDAGHQIAALLAYDQLSSEARAQAGVLLRAHPRFAADFATRLPRSLHGAAASEQDRWYFRFAGTWPDIARDFAGVHPEAARRALVARYHRPHWHYINLPTYLSASDRGALSVADPPLDWSPALPEMGLDLVQALTREQRILGSCGADSSRRGLALSWLLHLMADLHQPLHATSLYAAGLFPHGDRGGNDIGIRGGGNLHALWDAATGAAADWHGRDERAGQLAGGSTTLVSFADVAWQTRQLAKSEVYSATIRSQLRRLSPGAPVRVTVDAVYRRAAAATAQMQVSLASRRTAAWLEAPLLARRAKCPGSLAF